MHSPSKTTVQQSPEAPTSTLHSEPKRLNLFFNEHQTLSPESFSAGHLTSNIEQYISVILHLRTGLQTLKPSRDSLITDLCDVLGEPLQFICTLTYPVVREAVSLLQRAQCRNLTGCAIIPSLHPQPKTPNTPKAQSLNP